MEILVVEQGTSMQIIRRAYENFKKTPKDRLGRSSHITGRIENLEGEWAKFIATHRKIIALNENEEDEYFTNVYDKTEEIYFDCLSDMKDALAKLNPNIQNTLNVSNSIGKPNVRLPKISIPTFSGKYNEWTTFKDMYLSLIHNNEQLDDVQKMHYLKSHLTGEAEQLLRHVPITSANYQEAWATLNSRYDNKKFLSNCLLRRFMNQPNIATESSNSIKDLLDTTVETLNGLKNLGIDVSSWDAIVIYIICSKLDTESRKQWEMSISASDKLPTLSEMKIFLESRFHSLEFIDLRPKPRTPFSGYKPKVLHTALGGNVSEKMCSFCNGKDHKIGTCIQFFDADVNTRRNFAQDNELCFNCLSKNHSVIVCTLNKKCHYCKKKHHSLLHIKKELKPPTSDVSSELAGETKEAVYNVLTSLNEDQSTANVVTHLSSQSRPNQILLATALVEAQAANGNTQTLRAVVDQCSEASLVTESVATLLKLKREPTNTVITGVGGDTNGRAVVSKSMVTMKIQSRLNSDFQLEVHAYVLGAITKFLPSRKITKQDWPKLAVITLADPEFHTPNKIDILLGADVYGQLIEEGLIKDPQGLQVAQNTAFGWIVSGPAKPIENDQRSSKKCYHNIVTTLHVHVEEDEMLKKFWAIESEIGTSKILSEEEQLCEDFYDRTTKRDDTGRYIVRIPFRDENPQQIIGNTRNIAVKRLYSLENRFKKIPEVKPRYAEVFHEYINLDHMARIDNNRDAMRSVAIYTPHFAVIREDRTTTKVRMVLDAACKGTNGVSLNDTMMIGPRLQQDLRHIIMRWRMHPICMSADIVKMYRQIKVADEETHFQRLLWRDDPSSEIEEYRMLRVTFGTASAPYLAVKSLQQVAIDEGISYPLVAEKVKTDFYVDDLLTGCQTVEEGKEIYKQMTELLSKGGFEIQKWITNDKELAAKIMQGNDDKKVEIKLDEIVKVLGLYWDRETDTFKYSVNFPDHKGSITKRKVISDISRLFDPLGWVAPCVITAKIIIQKLWLSGIDWDEELPSALLKEWLSYKEELFQVREYHVRRWGETKADDKSVELHGFCDASNLAYAAVVYVRAVDERGNVHVNLITAKTKVAPIMQVSVPRLELMGAVLMARLLTEVATVLSIGKSQLHGWTDSTVVLAWLSSHPSRWTTFIGNRTSEILTRMDNLQWAHVQSIDNPADIASRGMSPSELVQNDLWKQGPSWLSAAEIKYTKPQSSTDLEQRRIKVHLSKTDEMVDDQFWTKYSSLSKLVHVVAYIRRFLKVKMSSKFASQLSCEEINEALDVCIRHCQKQLNEDKNRLKSLCPSTDANGIIRANGRLENASIPESAKHPIILPHKSHFTNLVIDEAHKKTLHGGPTLMLNYLRSKYWIISAKNLVKAHVHKCVICTRHAAAIKTQLMGQLPVSRVTPAKPFLHSGVDLAGPINLRMSKGRGNKSYKGYICLFVCMVTKAIHLEVVSDLTSTGFIEAFKRFVGRRGRVTDMWSDNGTNFVGASKELQRLLASENSSVDSEIRNFTTNRGVNWHFIPSHAPNFGGLWEAGVKSTKFHLKRVVGESKLTYEELSTVLIQVEACLNSRPLSSLPNSPSEPAPLTPGHFLVGEPLVVVAEKSYMQSTISSLRRWQLTQRMVQEFWKRWSDDYLKTCMHRYKWDKHVREPNVGEVVLIKEDNLPPARWLMAIIVDKHPGKDNITRVATLKCNGSLINRPTSKLCILPVAE